MRLSKKGQLLSESLMIGWRLALIAALILFVALTVGSTFTAKKDIRPLEAAILSHRAIECISGGGVVERDFDLKKCFNDETEIYVHANLTSMESNFSRTADFGNNDIGVYCKLQENLAYCSNQKFYVLIDSKNSERGVLELTAGVRKYNSNVNSG